MTTDRSLFTPQGDNPPHAVPFGDGRTVPTEEAVMWLTSLCGEGKSVLEIGTGSGYQTAVLAERFPVVVSIEIDPHPGVEDKLPANVVLIHADGSSYETGEEFDAVLVTFASPSVSHSWWKQVREGGRLIVPVMTRPNGLCRVCVYQKNGRTLQLLDVPMYASFTRMEA